LLVAEQSRFNMHGRTDHAWSCDDCGHEFVTSIRVADERAPAMSDNPPKGEEVGSG
jgi:hypothetical protein